MYIHNVDSNLTYNTSVIYRYTYIYTEIAWYIYINTSTAVCNALHHFCPHEWKILMGLIKSHEPSESSCIIKRFMQKRSWPNVRIFANMHWLFIKKMGPAKWIVKLVPIPIIPFSHGFLREKTFAISPSGVIRFDRRQAMIEGENLRFLRDPSDQRPTVWPIKSELCGYLYIISSTGKYRYI